jgi:hypothetical protein
MRIWTRMKKAKMEMTVTKFPEFTMPLQTDSNVRSKKSLANLKSPSLKTFQKTTPLILFKLG